LKVDNDYILHKIRSKSFSLDGACNHLLGPPPQGTPTWDFWDAHQFLVYQKSNQSFTPQISEPFESCWQEKHDEKRSHYSILNHQIIKFEEEKV